MKSAFIDYRRVEQAILYYQGHGYEYIEVPWVVSKEAYRATAPVGGNEASGDMLVASGEQSFIRLAMMCLLGPGKHVCATPCYRPWDGGRSAFHHGQFFKVELIHYSYLFLEHLKPEYEQRLDAMVLAAKTYFSQLVPDIQVIDTNDDPRLECTTHKSKDIVTKDGIELGSYGIRSHPKVGAWVYGTGLALPRMSQIMSR